MIRRPIGALLRDRRGVALLEFAFVLPILLLLYLGGYQISDAVACKRKVTITTRSVADLTTQYSTLSQSQLTSILNASSQIMTPYNASNAMVRVSELYTDANGNTTVVWSSAINGGGRTLNSSYSLPTAIATPNTYLVLSEVQYAYQPLSSFYGLAPVQLSDMLYMSPRTSASISVTAT